MATTVTKMKDGSVKFKGKETATLRFALKDVWFYFLTTAPRPKKGKKFVPEFPAKDSSYSVQVLVSDEDILDEIEKSKSRDGYSKVTRAVVKAEDFKEQFKCEPPFEAKKYYFLKLTRHASFSDGATYEGSHYIPVVQLKDGKVEKHAQDVIAAKPHKDHDAKKSYDAIITTPMIGNGSKGHVILSGSWYEFEDEVNQKPIQESFVITELVPYVSSGKSAEVSEDDMAALGLEGLEVVEAEKPKTREQQIVEEIQEEDDDEPMEDPESDDEGFETE